MEELETKKLKTKNKVLIVLLIISIICVLGVASYAYFMCDNNKDEIPVDVSKLTENIEYSYLLDKKTKNVKDLSPEQMMLIAYMSYGREISYYEYDWYPSMDYSDNVELPTNDIEGVAYPDYNKETKKLYCNDNEEYYVIEGQVKNMARYLRIDVSKIEKMDTSLFSCYGGGGGGGSIYVLDSEFISSRMKNLFGTDNNIFDKSFNYTAGENINNLCGYYKFTYDKNIDTFFLSSSGGCTIGSISSTLVTREYLEDDLYKMDVAEYMMGEEFYQDSYPKIIKIYNVDEYRSVHSENDEPTALGTITINDKVDEQNITSKIEKYKDKLNNYTLTYKKVEGTYQFVSIDYKG